MSGTAQFCFMEYLVQNGMNVLADHEQAEVSHVPSSFMHAAILLIASSVLIIACQDVQILKLRLALVRRTSVRALNWDLN